MDAIRDRELGIVGERYGSFTEFYSVNERRSLNATYADAGEGACAAPFEVDAGVMFSPKDTKEALLRGSALYEERFERAAADAWRALHHKYEWLDERHFETDVLGQNVLVERYMSGHPETFARKRTKPLKERCVNIVYDVTCSASTSVERRIQAGAAVLAAAHALERIGYRTALTLAVAKYSGGLVASDPTLLLEVLVKTYKDSLNARRMQFALAGKSVLFHVGAWWTRRFPHVPCDYGKGEGYPVTYDPARVRALEKYESKRHGIFLTEDFVDLKLGADSVRVLEQVVEHAEGMEELKEHLRASTPIASAVSPEQGRLFSSYNVETPEGAGQGRGAGTAPQEKRADGDVTGSAPADRPKKTRKKTPFAPAPMQGQAASSAPSAQGAAHEGGERGSGSGEGRTPVPEDSASGPDALSFEGAGHERRSGNEGADGLAGTRGSSGEEGPRAQESPSPESGEGAIQGAGALSSRRDSGTDGEGPGSKAGGDEHGTAKAERSDAGDAPDARPKRDAQSSSGEGPQQDRKSPRGGRGATGPDDTGNETRRSAGSQSEKGAGSAAGAGKQGDDSRDDKEQEMAEQQGQQEKDQRRETLEVPAESSDDKLDLDSEALDELQEEPFVDMLRRRITSFEDGSYLRMQIDQKMAQRAQKKRLEKGVVPPPPAATPGTTGPVMGKARNTPFSMTYRP